MTCMDGCPTHVFDQPGPPTGADDPCNNSGNGFFCVGSWWHTVGDCGNDILYLRAGDTCNVNQWIEFAVPTRIEANIPPEQGVDCCPVGSIWVIPPGALNGNFLQQVYISLGNCEWCLICGEETIQVSLELLDEENPLHVLPPVGVWGDVSLDTINNDVLNEVTIVNNVATFTPTRSGWYQFVGCGLLHIPDFSGFTNNSFTQCSLMINGVIVNRYDVWADIAPNTTPTADYVGARQFQGTIMTPLVAGDVVRFMVRQDLWVEPLYFREPDTWFQITKVR